jgi:hypothetical protein
MSETITHIAVTDDCAALCIHSREICDEFTQCLSAHLDVARLGGLTRSGGPHMPGLLERYSRDWPGRGPDDPLARKLAFVLGWHFHRAADLQFKPVFRQVDAGSDESPTECSVYHDVFCFRELYAGGQRPPMSPETLADPPRPSTGEHLGVEAMETLLRTLWQRALIAQHTFIPDEQDVDGWIERLLGVQQRFRVDLRRYAEALARPDPEKVRRYVDETGFYNRDDGLIRLARSIDAKGSPSAEARGTRFLDALDSAGQGSLYARALRRGYLYVRAASEYFQGEIDREAYLDALERGKQGVPQRGDGG